MNSNFKIQKPILLKIDPDLNNSQLLDIISVVKQKLMALLLQIRQSKENLKSKINLISQKGGISGKPLQIEVLK